VVPFAGFGATSYELALDRRSAFDVTVVVIGHRSALPRLGNARFAKRSPPMAAISTSDIKNGITIKLDDGLFTVIEFQHVQAGQGWRVRAHQVAQLPVRVPSSNARTDRTNAWSRR